MTLKREVSRAPWTAKQPRVEQEYERARSRTTNRALYATAAWRKLRTLYLADHPHCAVPGCRRPATVVDHVIAHRGEQTLFFDPANLQALCKPHHDSKTAREDGGFGQTRAIDR